MRRAWKWAAVGVVAVFVVIQLVPYGRDHTNPTGGQPISWDSPRTEQLMRGACMDCHSNETTWPLYSYVAPVSWLVRQHVEEGRRQLNFSEWGTRRDDAREAADAIEEGSMPPRYYTVMHPAARLTADEKQQLIDALDSMDGRSRRGSSD